MKGASKALLLGSAAGFGYGLQAAVTKTFVGELGHGALSLLADWSVYVLVISAVVGFVLQQGALKTGVLAPAMASSNAVTLFSSVVLGIVVYGERLSASGGGHVASAAVGLGSPSLALCCWVRPRSPHRRSSGYGWPPLAHSDRLTWFPPSTLSQPRRRQPSNRRGTRGTP